MAKFIYITDTHLGGSSATYKQQIPYREKLEDLLILLDEKIKKIGDIDFVVNGGDVIDRHEDALIEKVKQIFKLSKPVYLCLGNHDLTAFGGAEYWLNAVPEFFKDNSLHFELVTEDCVFHVLPNHWCEDEYFWEREQSPYFSDRQLERLAEKLESNKCLPHIICTHANIIGVAQEQTGFSEEYHIPNEAFNRTLADLIKSYPQITCVVCAHNHINSINWIDNVPVVSASSFTESPFDFKLFEISNGVLSIKTLNLFDNLPSKVDYNFNKTFVQGRDKDRNITFQLGRF
jgi:DNA repair exonuclease SbcCD nuclease subunit